MTFSMIFINFNDYKCRRRTAISGIMLSLPTHNPEPAANGSKKVLITKKRETSMTPDAGDGPLFHVNLLLLPICYRNFTTEWDGVGCKRGGETGIQLYKQHTSR